MGADTVGSGGLRGCPTIICPREEMPILLDAPVVTPQGRLSGTSPHDIDRELRAAKLAKNGKITTALYGAQPFLRGQSPIDVWVSLDPASRDTSRTQKRIFDYEAQGNCVSSKEFVKESYPVRGQRNDVTIKAEINVGMSFLSRFNVQMAGGSIEVRRPTK
jgi:hypothetical protein